MATAMQGLSLSPELANPDDFDQAVRMLASASKDLDGVSSDRVSPLPSHPSSSFASRPTPTVVHAFVSPSSSVVSSLPSSTPLPLASTSLANSSPSSFHASVQVGPSSLADSASLPHQRHAVPLSQPASAIS